MPMLQWFYTIHVLMAVLFIAFACMHWARCWMMIFPGVQTRGIATAEMSCLSPIKPSVCSTALAVTFLHGASAAAEPVLSFPLITLQLCERSAR